MSNRHHERCLSCKASWEYWSYKEDCNDTHFTQITYAPSGAKMTRRGYLCPTCRPQGNDTIKEERRKPFPFTMSFLGKGNVTIDYEFCFKADFPRAEVTSMVDADGNDVTDELFHPGIEDMCLRRILNAEVKPK